MIISNKGIKLLTEWEGLRLKPYDDQTGEEISSWVKGATIGYGYLIPSDQWDRFKNGIKKSEADELLREGLIKYESTVTNFITAKISQNKFDALVIFCYNIGRTGFANSSVVKMINDPDYKSHYNSIEDAWKAWKKSQGKVMQGLINRRNKEWELYNV